MLILVIGSSCVCRPLYQVPADSAEASSASATPGTPSTTSNPGRIQKPPRKQSNLQAAPNNIAKALKIEPQQVENDFKVTSVPHSNFEVRSPEKPSAPEQTPQPHIEASTAVPKTGGCCSQNSAPAAPAPSHSCCSSKESQEPKEKAVDSAYASWAAPSHMEPLLWNTSLQNGHYSSETPGYSSLAQPSSSYVTQADSNSPVVSQPHYMSHMQVGGTFDTMSMNQLSFNPAEYPLNLPSTFTLDSNHDCSCGETCQCLGCASHPYNETTTQHVQKMGFLMSIDEENANLNKSTTSLMGPGSSPLTMSPNGTTHTPTFADNTMLQTSNFDSSLSSGGNNAFASDQFMQPSEYYTIEYSVGLSLCSNVSGTCQCGNDCSCVGCLTHDGHNGVALQHPSPSAQQQRQQQHQTTRETTPQRYNEYAGYTTNIPRTLDQYSPSVLSPQIVEAPFV